jgi:hypothetical protein
MNLNGTWSFELDPQDRGIADGWFKRALKERIELPGALTAQGFGPEVSVDTEWTGSIFDRSWYEDERFAAYRQPGNIKVPCWLQPERHYQGAAWYSMPVEIPTEWQGKRVTLFLEFPHWETRLWLDGREIGSNIALSVPHVFDIGKDCIAGQHTLTLRIDNRMLVEVGPNAHSMTDHTQGNWNGVAGRMELNAGDPLWIEDVQVFPSLQDKTVRLRLKLGNQTNYTGAALLTVNARAYNCGQAHQAAPLAHEFEVGPNQTSLELTYPLGAEALPWDEFSPALYRLSLELEAGTFSDRRELSFGLREVSVQGTRLAINKRPIFIRGTLECCIFPLTGYPPTSVDEWKRIMGVAQAHGLNQFRFHSWCPPEAAFTAADELGFYCQVECASWANQGASIGDGGPIDTWLYDEAWQIIRFYGNHPSFIMMAYGNEPAGQIEEYLGKWVSYWKEQDPRRLHTSGAGWPAIEVNDYHSIPQPRIHAWGAGLSSRINAQPPETHADYREWVTDLKKPIVSHEIGQWCVYPTFEETQKYTGLLKARNFEIFQETLTANHMGDQARDFLMASGKLQALCYKEEIESALRTPGFAGFQLLDLHDFPGQGTALVGVLDPFWESKGYISAAEYKRFCNSTVPLARMKKRVWTSAETFSADLEAAHFGPAALAGVSAEWRLLDSQGVNVAGGVLAPVDLPVDNAIALGSIHLSLAALPAPARYRLVVGLAGTAFENDWDIWVYPAQLRPAAPNNVRVSPALDEEAITHLNAGGTLLLMPPAGKLSSPVVMGFSSIFWNTAWTNNQPPHTLGILVDPAHPLFAHFPSEYHTNWQWWEPLQLGTALVLDDLPTALRPLIQPIDTWFENRRLGVLLEARVGQGKLVLSSLDLTCGQEDRPASRQLLHSLYSYMGGEQFDPQVELSLEQVGALLDRHQ